ncbi:restriction endonuclease subunit S [Pontiellaceae bacterium B1224]|nr:restriction endonuclease subunit S [Pontiellaceae bacterium B1224]
MRGFSEIQLGDALTFQRGFDITKKEQTPGNIPIVSSSGVSSTHNKFKVEGPGVVIGRKGTLGTVHYIPNNFWPHDTTLWIRDFKGNNPRFLSYFLKTLYLENFDTGSSNPTLNRNHIHKIKVIFPNRKIQNKIAAILSAYDELIENNRRRIVLLERIAEELYREWFVRFRFPNHQTTPFKKGIPEGWESISINEFVDFKSGFAFKSKTYLKDGKHGIVTIKNVHNGKFVSECTDSINEPPSKLPKHCFLKTGDILMSLTGNVGRVCIFFGSNMLLNQRVVVLKPKTKNQSHFIYWMFRQNSMTTFSEMISTGAAQQNLSPIKLGNQSVIFPSLEIIESYQAKVSPLMEQILVLQKENETLTRTKNALLPRLISGSLSVEELAVAFPPGME